MLNLKQKPGKKSQIPNTITGSGTFVNVRFSISDLFRISLFAFSICLLLASQEANAATIGRPMNNAGLLSYYDFQTGINGTTAYDKSGNRKNGTFVNMEAASDWVNGRIGQGLDFDGSSEYIQTNINELKTAENFTVSFWFNADATDYAHHIFWAGRSTANGYGEVAGGSTNQEFHLSLGEFNGVSANNKLAIFLGDTDEANGDPIQVSTDFSDTTNWHHIVGVFSNLSTSPTGHMYVDGVLIGTDTGTTADTARDGWDTSVRIGRPGANQRYFNGLIDEIRVYTRALSADEVTRLHNFSAPKIAKTPTVVSDGLVGHWTMDGNVTTSATAGDISQSNIDGSITGAQPISGKIGQALQFDGDDDQINLGDPASLQLTSSMTISAWINADDLTGQGAECCAVIVNKMGFSPARAYSLHTSSEDARFYIASNGSTLVSRFSSAALTTGEWYHVAGVYDAAAQTMDVYINGALDNGEQSGAIPTSQHSNNGEPVYIGGRADFADQNFDGLIDDVRIYNRALTADEIKRIYNATRPSEVNVTRSNDSLVEGLLAHWTFDGGNMSSTNAYDSSGNNITGTLAGDASPVIGQLGQGLVFDGTNDWVDMGDVTFLNGLTALTASTWIYMDAHPGGTVSVLRKDGEANIAQMQGGSLWVMALWDSGLTQHQIALSNIPTGRWAHVVNVWDANANSGSPQLYVDGELIGSFTLTSTGSLTNSANAFRLGATESGTEDFTGKLDDVRIYNRALSADEIKRLYNLGH